MSKITKWSVPWEKVAKKINIDQETLIRKSSLDLFNAIIKKTPVDKRILIGNWRFSRNRIDNSTDKNKKGSGFSIQQAQGALGIKSGDIAYFTNSMPYAYGIEFEGKSRVKAPSGMVRVSVREFNRFIKRNLK